ncbi:MAG: UDP-3-O-(3-hydroxymyristoyl)glucosamine N-acyltransferase [Bacteroidota bacterium]
MKFKVGDIAQYLSGTVAGDSQKEVENIAAIERASEGDLTFLSNPKYESFLYTTQASAVIVSQDLELKQPVSCVLIKVKDPYSSFTMVLEMVEQSITPRYEGIESPSFIHEDAQVGEDVYVGAFAYIGKGAVIGDRAKIFPNCYVGEGATIGSDSILLPGAAVHHSVQIGNHCTLHHGAVIGAEGFGFAPQADGSYRRTPQLGTVILEDYVSVGANTTIDRATFDATVIKKGVKLDNLVQIAHNCTVGEHTVMAAQVGVAGSAHIGAKCMLGGQVGVSGHINIADGSKVVPQSGIMSSIEAEGQSWMGSPIVESKQHFRITAAMRRLPDLIKQVRALEKKLEQATGG